MIDTSVIVARGEGEAVALPDEAAISTMTLAELHVGVLLADETRRAGRLAVLAEVEREFDPLPVDAAVARRFGELVAASRRGGRRPKVAAALIAATAARHGVPLYTRDRDFVGMPEVDVVLT